MSTALPFVRVRRTKVQVSPIDKHCADKRPFSARTNDTCCSVANAPRRAVLRRCGSSDAGSTGGTSFTNRSRARASHQLTSAGAAERKGSSIACFTSTCDHSCAYDPVPAPSDTANRPRLTLPPEASSSCRRPSSSLQQRRILICMKISSSVSDPYESHSPSA